MAGTGIHEKTGAYAREGEPVGLRILPEKWIAQTLHRGPG